MILAQLPNLLAQQQENEAAIESQSINGPPSIQPDLDYIHSDFFADQLSAFESLGLDYHCMHEDLGASIAKESESVSIWKRQLDDLSWFDSYHPYEDHYQYFSNLHDAFPDNSEFISSGTSYEGRDIWGLHLWGADGPGKPAVLWHGTVHAREWISAMVGD